MSSGHGKQVEQAETAVASHPGLDTPELVSLAEYIQQTLPFNELSKEVLYLVICGY